MVEVLDVHGTHREAKEDAYLLNATRPNGVVYGCRRTIDGRWEVIRVTVKG